MVMGRRGYRVMRNSEVWYWRMDAPTNARFALLKRGSASAEGSIRARARICKGILEDRESRACRAASLAEYRARSGGGDGNGAMCSSSGSSIGGSSVSFISSRTTSDVVVCHLLWQHRGACNLEVWAARHILVELGGGLAGVVESN